MLQVMLKMTFELKECLIKEYNYPDYPYSGATACIYEQQLLPFGTYKYASRCCYARQLPYLNIHYNIAEYSGVSRIWSSGMLRVGTSESSLQNLGHAH